MMEDDGAGIRDAREGSGEDAVAALDFFVGEIVVELPVELGGKPVGGKAGGATKVRRPLD